MAQARRKKSQTFRVKTITASEAERRAEKSFQIIMEGVEKQNGKPMSMRERQKMSRLLKPAFLALLSASYAIVPDGK